MARQKKLNEQDIREALSFIYPDDREVWYRMGLAVKSELGKSGFNLWDEWSRRDTSYNKADARDVWKSLPYRSDVTIGSLIYVARQYGWVEDDKAKEESDEEYAARMRRIEREKAAEKARAKALAEQARNRAIYMWNNATPHDDWFNHSYCERKVITPHGSRIAVIDDKDLLLIPMINAEGYIQSLQVITKGGKKRFLKGTIKNSLFCQIGEITDDTKEIGIVEGYATGCTIHDEEEIPVLVAFDSGNLLSVCEQAVKKYGNERITVFADDDRQTQLKQSEKYGITYEEAAKFNAGLTAANLCRSLFNVGFEWPPFEDYHPIDLSDFNDYVTYRAQCHHKYSE